MVTRPVDFQATIPKLPELGRMQKEREAHWQVKNQQFAAELQQLALTRQKKVVTSPQAEKAEADKQTEKRRKRHERPGKSPKQEAGSTDSAEPERSLGHHIDIRT